MAGVFFSGDSVLAFGGGGADKLSSRVYSMAHEWEQLNILGTIKSLGYLVFLHIKPREVEKVLHPQSIQATGAKTTHILDRYSMQIASKER